MGTYILLISKVLNSLFLFSSSLQDDIYPKEGFEKMSCKKTNYYLFFKGRTYDKSHHVSSYNLKYILLIARCFCLTERKRYPYYTWVWDADLTLQHCALAKVKSYTNELSNYVYNFRLDICRERETDRETVRDEGWKCF